MTLDMLLAKKIEFIFIWRVGGGGVCMLEQTQILELHAKYHSLPIEVGTMLSVYHWFFLCFFSITNTPEGVAHIGICLHVFI